MKIGAGERGWMSWRCQEHAEQEERTRTEVSNQEGPRCSQTLGVSAVLVLVSFNPSEGCPTSPTTPNPSYTHRAP